MQNNPEIEQIVDAAVKIARDNQHEYVLTEHVLLALVRYEPFRKVLDKYGADVAMLDQELETYIRSLTSLVKGTDVQPKKTNALERCFNRALTQVLFSRTSAEMAQPAPVDLNAPQINADMLSPYPIIYWRMTPDQAKPSPKAFAAVSAYLHHGGMVVFDAPEQAGAAGGAGSVAKMEEFLRMIDLPPLVRMADDHVLMRSFYLMQGMPGRFSDAPIYIEKGSSANDGVSSVVIGGNDWASAWAREASGLPLFPVVPGGESQREMAYRAGVNMVMYALTGNYKSDQVHLPHIMQRLTQ